MASTTQSTTTNVLESRRWTGGINYRSLREALDFLDVNLPVHIRRANGTRRLGAHRFRNGGHFITVSTYLTVAQANRTLLHELAHAAQLERHMTGDRTPQVAARVFAVAYESETRRCGGGRYGYRANRFEVEAREASGLESDFQVAK